MTGDTPIRQKVRRIGEHDVEAAVGMFGGDGVEDFETVALVEEDAVGVVPVGAVERREGVAVHDNAVERAAGGRDDDALRPGGVAPKAFGVCDGLLGLSWHG